MIEIEKARTIAIKFLNDEKQTIVSTKHTTDKYLFVFDCSDATTPTPGAPIVVVDKNSGNVEFLKIPSKEAFAILNKAKAL